jgi:predicted nucleic acid-binding protein
MEVEADLGDKIDAICLKISHYGYRRVTHELVVASTSRITSRRMKYVVGVSQKALMVSLEVHIAVKKYARDHNLTMVEAVYRLLRKVVPLEEGIYANSRGDRCVYA